MPATQAKDAALIAEHAARADDLERTRQEQQDLAAHGQALQKALDAKDLYIAVLGAAAEGSAQQAQQAQQAGHPPSATVQEEQPQPQLAQQQPRMLQAPEAALAPLPRQQSGSDLAGVTLSSAVKEQLQRMSEYPMSFMVQMDLPLTAHPGGRGYLRLAACALAVDGRGEQVVHA